MKPTLILILFTLMFGALGIAVALIKDGNPWGWGLGIFALVTSWQGLKPSK